MEYKQALFLDRDGVVNRRIVGSYVRNWTEFEFLEGVLKAMPIFKQHFDYIFIVTNQQGIGKGVMTEADLLAVHTKMIAEVEQAGGRIDAAYHCPYLSKDKPRCRKPNIGMALDAQAAYPDFDLANSIMVGDSPSDMEFGRNCKMKTVFIETKVDLTEEEALKTAPMIDKAYPSLLEFAEDLPLFLKETKVN
jgi:D-glycero-D-manno-heptose 1,7-bisphosphate phosphatase